MIRFAAAITKRMVMPVLLNVQALPHTQKVLVKKRREEIDPNNGGCFEGRQIFISIVGSKHNH